MSENLPHQHLYGSITGSSRIALDDLTSKKINSHLLGTLTKVNLSANNSHNALSFADMHSHDLSSVASSTSSLKLGTDTFVSASVTSSSNDAKNQIINHNPPPSSASYESENTVDLNSELNSEDNDDQYMTNDEDEGDDEMYFNSKNAQNSHLVMYSEDSANNTIIDSTNASSQTQTTSQYEDEEKINYDHGINDEDEEYYISEVEEQRNIDDEEYKQFLEQLDAEFGEEDTEFDISNDIVFEYAMEHTSRNTPPKPFRVKYNDKIEYHLQYVFAKNNKVYLDPDDEDTFEPSMVAEYAPEIFNYMCKLERKLRPNPNYMLHQQQIKWYMRTNLIDWLVQVHFRFRLFPETLYLAVNYIDRFLSKKNVSPSKLQLVGLLALFIAAKYEEINCPSLHDICAIANNQFPEEEILTAEKFMIDALEFDLGWPGPMCFLRRTSKADDYDHETRTLAKYLLESTIMEYKLLAALPSWLAAASHFLARSLLNKGEWTPAHIFYSGYTVEQLIPIAAYILQSCRDARRHHSAVFNKYSTSTFRRVATYVQNWFDEQIEGLQGQES